ncbi:MAG: hypothetical protein EOP07_07985 [Proteobacteria bacterium]|nr:MAG: hypothetical protein EOP07_07985 [Pseudomonadota bacterium]
MMSLILKKIQVSLGLSLSIAALSLGISSGAEASTGRLARAEFIYLQYMADSQDYQAAQTYVVVEGSNFIGLQKAFSETRTCLFGFNRTDSEGYDLMAVETEFVCFNTDRYNLILYKEYCVSGGPGCEIDPAGISIGIGNLNIFQGEPSTEEPKNPLLSNLTNQFPTELIIKLNGDEATSEWKPRPLPGRYNGSPLILGR